jgi:uncharacterized protein YbgA (DUF1722 family)
MFGKDKNKRISIKMVLRLYGFLCESNNKKEKKERGKVFEDFRRYFQRYYGRIFINSHFVTRPLEDYLAHNLDMRCYRYHGNSIIGFNCFD